MHIPDGFLSPPVWAAAGAISVPGVAYFARKTHNALEEGQIPLMGVMGAFVFAAQMINFPVGVGTSGHLVGGALLAVTLGPAAATIVMTAILTIQALLFQDGGVLALGANIFNMAIAGVFVGYLPYRIWGASKGRNWAIFVGAFLSVFITACLAMSQLLFSGVRMPGVAAAISLALFALSGVIEGAITVSVVGALEKLNPHWVRTAQPRPKAKLSVILIAAILLASVGALLASSLPDGLEKLAEDAGISSRALNLIQTPFGDYEAKFVDASWMRKALAGLVGLSTVYLACLAIGRVAAKRVARS